MKYRVQFDGFSSFRKSDRTYTHAVLVRCSHREYLAEQASRIESRLASIRADIARLEAGNLDRYEDAGSLERMRASLVWVQDRSAKDLTNYLRNIGLGLGCKPAAIPASFDVYYAPATWCGRPDLAAKECAKRAGSVVALAEVVA